MKNISELKTDTILRCPVGPNGETWAEVILYGKFSIEALDKLLAILVEMRNGWAEDLRPSTERIV